MKFPPINLWSMPLQRRDYMITCEHWDSGWCYHPDSLLHEGCPGKHRCLYTTPNVKEMLQQEKSTISPEHLKQMLEHKE